MSDRAEVDIESLKKELLITGWTDLENYGEKFVEAYNNAVHHTIDHLHQRGLLTQPKHVGENPPSSGEECTQPKHIEGLADAIVNFGTPLWDLNDGVYIIRAARAYNAIMAKEALKGGAYV